jgi:hypothetical protein
MTRRVQFDLEVKTTENGWVRARGERRWYSGQTTLRTTCQVHNMMKRVAESPFMIHSLLTDEYYLRISECVQALDALL